MSTTLSSPAPVTADASSLRLDALVESGLVPDALVRAGIRRNLRLRLREEDQGSLEANQSRLMAYVRTLCASPIAIDTRAANAQQVGSINNSQWIQTQGVCGTSLPVVD